jgi:exonuclease V gamma subunit
LEKEEPCPEGAASPNILKSAPFPSVRILRLKDLVTLLEEPCRLFLTRLGLRLPEEEEELETGDFLKPGTLHNWSLQDQLLRALLENPDGIEALKERLSAAGDLPRGKYGDKTWEDAKKKTPKVENGPFAPLNHSFEIKITDSQGQDWLLKDTMPAGWYQKEGDPTADGTAFFFSASTLDRKRKLKLKLELLCLAVSGGAKKVTARFKDNKSESVVLSEKNTSELLKNLVDLYALARCLPLPFWPKAYDAMCTAKKAKSPASDAKCPTENQQPTAEELRKKACAECEESLRKAYAEWNPEYRGESSSPERDSAATRFAFRGLDDPFTWKPTLPDLPWLAEGGADKPLAWRLGRFINAWESKFNEQPTQETPSKPQDN